MLDIKIKPKSCRICKELFIPRSGLQKVCGIGCAIALSVKVRQKREKCETKALKAKLKTRSQWMKEAQSVFNQFIRLRDKDAPCISCQRHHAGQYHAGHYRTVGAMPQLRFSEYNTNKQCSACNNYLSGNIVEYRINLINKIGLERVEWLEGKHEPVKYTIADIMQIKEIYKRKLKELQDENQH